MKNQDKDMFPGAPPPAGSPSGDAGGFRPGAGAFQPNRGAFVGNTGYFDPRTGASQPGDRSGLAGAQANTAASPGFAAGAVVPRTEVGMVGVHEARRPADQAPTPIEVPVPTSPKGGGAVQPIAEKFAANPATGSGGASVSFALPPSPRGLGPSLGLSYDTGAGNGPFGLGWSLGVPQITRKTDKKLPEYRDHEDGDTFVLAGAEDLVPELYDDQGEWKRRIDKGVNEAFPHRYYYRPRTEGSFSRIVRVVDSGGADLARRIEDEGYDAFKVEVGTP